jgi:hypothetical protein
MSSEKLEVEAQRVLLNNRRGKYTLPSKNIYPFQWKWDSGFIALGLSYFNLNMAMEELRTLFAAQWSNGFVPHIVFHKTSEKFSYFPDAGFYQADLSPYSNPSFQTTSLTQPPVEGWVLERIVQISGENSEINAFVKEMFPKILAQHEYLYKYRDPLNEGLVYIQHNWESGTDNSPVWDEIWASFDAPVYGFNRKDTKHVHKEQRPLQREYDYYLYLVDLFKKLKYRDEDIANQSPFLVQDPLFNSMLIASNHSLIRLAEQAGHSEKVKQLKEWNKNSISAMNTKLYDKQNRIYRHYDLRNKKWLEGLTSSGFAPLFSGVPTKSMVKDMLQTMLRFSKNNKYFLIPSFDPDLEAFESQRYWRGPVWVNVNWLVYRGLIDYGFTKMAQQLKADTIQMVNEQGFYEYFEPDKEKSKYQNGYGGDAFSWTAALMIDLLKEEQ